MDDVSFKLVEETEKTPNSSMWSWRIHAGILLRPKQLRELPWHTVFNQCSTLPDREQRPSEWYKDGIQPSTHWSDPNDQPSGRRDFVWLSELGGGENGHIILTPDARGALPNGTAGPEGFDWDRTDPIVFLVVLTDREFRPYVGTFAERYFRDYARDPAVPYQSQLYCEGMFGTDNIFKSDHFVESISA